MSTTLRGNSRGHVAGLEGRGSQDLVIAALRRSVIELVARRVTIMPTRDASPSPFYFVGNKRCRLDTSPRDHRG